MRRNLSYLYCLVILKHVNLGIHEKKSMIHFSDFIVNLLQQVGLETGINFCGIFLFLCWLKLLIPVLEYLF